MHGRLRGVMGKEKSRNDMDTAGVREEIISLCIFTSVVAPLGFIYEKSVSNYCMKQ